MSFLYMKIERTYSLLMKCIPENSNNDMTLGAQLISELTSIFLNYGGCINNMDNNICEIYLELTESQYNCISNFIKIFQNYLPRNIEINFNLVKEEI